ncbi:MAG TPA: hypothetical protein VJB59_06120 [Bdellovibrionota bacterium]|nr:hypothetical protein [Bdellovibrionota bacterium]
MVRSGLSFLLARLGKFFSNDRMYLAKLFGNLLRKNLTLEEVARPLPPRAPRVRLLPLHRISFRLEHFTRHSVIAVANLSSTGIGLIPGTLTSAQISSAPGSTQVEGLQSALGRLPGSGDIMRGHLLIHEASYKLVLRTVHLSEAVVGCAFQEVPRDLSGAIQSYLTAELSGTEMQYVGPESLEPNPEGTPHWYHGKNNSDLYLVENGGKIVRFCLVFLANYIEGGTDRPLRFGSVVKEESLENGGSIAWQDSFGADTLCAAVRLLTHIPHLPPEHKDGILRLIY